jgi:hypothetical protein
MSYRIKWLGVTVLVLGAVFGAQYVGTAVAHRGAGLITGSTMNISSDELTMLDGCASRHPH